MTPKLAWGENIYGNDTSNVTDDFDAEHYQNIAGLHLVSACQWGPTTP